MVTRLDSATPDERRTMVASGSGPHTVTGPVLDMLRRVLAEPTRSGVADS